MHRRLFDTFQYIMFLYHIATGLLVAVYRTAASALMTLFSLVRMDRNIFIRGFEKLDIGMHHAMLTCNSLTLIV